MPSLDEAFKQMSIRGLIARCGSHGEYHGQEKIAGITNDVERKKK
jgi:hypothetical protein